MNLKQTFSIILLIVVFIIFMQGCKNAKTDTSIANQKNVTIKKPNIVLLFVDDYHIFVQLN